MITPDDQKRADGLRFARRMHAPRATGAALGLFCVAAPLWENGAHPAAWALLFTHAFVWPHLAYAVARRARDPWRTERRNLMVDSALGGMWVVLIHFHLLASVVIITALCMDKLAVGGLRFLARTSVALVAGLVLTALAIGVEVRLGPSLLTTAACLPFLVVYPIAIAYVTDQLTRRVRQQNRQLEALNRIDRLSQLSNRSHWEETVMIEYQRYKRSGRTASLLMIDIDHFKAVNDRFGHGVGDDVIRSMGLLLRRSLRKADLAGRYGGEEFGVLLPDTAEQGALAIAERLREAIASATMSEAEPVRCTVSIGVSTLTRDTLGHLQWMDEADRALYAAKAAGRDRVQFSRTIAA